MFTTSAAKTGEEEVKLTSTNFVSRMDLISISFWMVVANRKYAFFGGERSAFSSSDSFFPASNSDWD